MSAEPFFELKANGSSLLFEDAAALRTWIEREHNFWSSVPGVMTANPHVHDDPRYSILTWLSEADEMMRAPDSNGEFKLQAVRERLGPYVRLGLISDAEKTTYILGLKRISPTTAAAALAHCMGASWNEGGRIPEDERYLAHVGRTAMDLFELGHSDAVGDAYASAALKMRDTFSSQISEFNNEGRELLAKIDVDRVAADRERLDWMKAARQQAEAAQANFNREGTEAIQQVYATEKAFKEQMKLRSSVQYWTKAAERHRTAANWQKGYLALFAVASADAAYLALPPFFAFTKDLAKELGEKATSPLLIVVAGAVLAASVVLWIARILVRVYQEERHRALDAAERAVMAETYCALTSEGLVTEAERVLALQALFRPAGEVSGKEEGPDTIQHAIMAKLLDGKTSK